MMEIKQYDSSHLFFTIWLNSNVDKSTSLNWNVPRSFVVFQGSKPSHCSPTNVSKSMITTRKLSRDCVDDCEIQITLPAWNFQSDVRWGITMHHYCDVIMGRMSSQITSLKIVYLTVYSGADQRKHQSSVSLIFGRRIHRWPVNSPHKWPVTWKMFPCDDVIMVHAVMMLIFMWAWSPLQRTVHYWTSPHAVHTNHQWGTVCKIGQHDVSAGIVGAWGKCPTDNWLYFP